MEKYEKIQPTIIEALQLTWDNWDKMCEFTHVGSSQDGDAEFCYVDKNNKPVHDKKSYKGYRMGLYLPTSNMLAVEGDYIIKDEYGQLYSCDSATFRETYKLIKSSSTIRVRI